MGDAKGNAEPLSAAVLEGLALLGATPGEAAAVLSIDEDSLLGVLDQDAGLAMAWRKGAAVGVQQVVKALYEAAKGGDVDAIKFWLTNRCPERWIVGPRGRAKPAEPKDATGDPPPTLRALKLRRA